MTLQKHYVHLKSVDVLKTCLKFPLLKHKGCSTLGWPGLFLFVQIVKLHVDVTDPHLHEMTHILLSMHLCLFNKFVSMGCRCDICSNLSKMRITYASYGSVRCKSIPVMKATAVATALKFNCHFTVYLSIVLGSSNPRFGILVKCIPLGFSIYIPRWHMFTCRFAMQLLVFSSCSNVHFMDECTVTELKCVVFYWVVHSW